MVLNLFVQLVLNNINYRVTLSDDKERVTAISIVTALVAEVYLRGADYKIQ